MPSVEALTAVTTEGGLIPGDLIARLVNETASFEGTRDEDYRLTPGTHLREIINRTWNDLLGAWEVFQPQADRLDPEDHTAGLTRDRWLLPLLRELGYGSVDRRATVVIEDKEYPVSHQHASAAIHLVGWNVLLDRRTAGVVGAAKASPHSMVQELLNRSDDHLWAIVSNGRQLRLLRDNASLTRDAFVEFDLETIFSEGLYTDFVALWLLAHASRIDAEPQDDCWLEKWAAEAREQGVRALESLGDGFENAITILGQGFLTHPANSDLLYDLREGRLDKQDYYRQILRWVYRLVFLLVTEERDVLHAPKATPEAREAYRSYYSMSRIRDLARRRRGTRHSDLWDQVVTVSKILGGSTGEPALGLPALGSDLWHPESTADVDRARISNRSFLEAVRHLAFTRRHNALHRVNYKNLGSEELGSVYESLLELRPVIELGSRQFSLATASGNERKTTGSYYTPTPLISALLDTSLDHLLDEAEKADDPQTAIRNLKVIDPACGSGHFLVAAAQRIARRLAAIRTGETNPPPPEARHALREVVARCVYGIDLNPMAVELCKVSLWLEAVEPGKPLSFLDHHIVCGNGLIGATPFLIADGVPGEAFQTAKSNLIEGDDQEAVKRLKKQNAKERKAKQQGLLALGWGEAEFPDLESVGSDSVEQVAEQARRYEEYRRNPAVEAASLQADAWCAAFMVVKDDDHPAITTDTVRMSAAGPSSVVPEALQEIRALAHRYRFLHWHLAFPEVFEVSEPDNPPSGWRGGFDLVFGNPPWETMSPDRREFFGQHIEGIRAMSPEEQEPAIEEALEDPVVVKEYEQYRRDLLSIVHFLKRSGRYTLFAKGNLGKGDFNVYRMFVETALRTARQGGYASQVAPANLYGGANASEIRKHLLDRCMLDTLIGCENANKSFFPDVHPQTWFTAYTARIGGRTERAGLCFGITNPRELPPKPDQVIDVAADLIRTQAPDTYAIPDLRNPFEMTVAAKMVSAHPPFGDQSAGPPQRHYQREVDMGNDTDLFTQDPAGLPVYEGRMINHFDHRAKSYVSGHGNSAVWEPRSFGDPEKAITPQWRVLRSNVPSKLGDRCDRYRIGFGDVANPRNVRSFVAALLPPGVICGDKVPTLDFGEDEWAYMPWLAVANSFAMDWLTRSRLSSAKLSFTLMDSLPFPRFDREDEVTAEIATRALRLTCTSEEMTPYWNRIAALPFGWCASTSDTVPADACIDPEERSQVRAEIDALVAKAVFGLSSEELEYVLDKFPVLRRRDEKAFGHFATSERILKIYDEVW